MQREDNSRVGRRRSFRVLYGAGLCTALAIAGYVCYAVYSANHMPDVEAAEQITAADPLAGYRRDTVAPLLVILTQEGVMEYGPVTHVWYRLPLTEAKMAPLAKLDHLERLDLIPPIGATGRPVTNPVTPSDRAAWPWLAKLHGLREVTIQNTDIRDEDLVHLEQLPRLRQIDLWGNPNLTPAGVDRLRRAQPDVLINYP